MEELNVNDNYKIVKMNYGFMLLKKITSLKRETKKEFSHWIEDGYYGKLEQLKSALLEKCISDNVTLLENIDMVIKMKNEILEMGYEKK